MKKPTPQQSRRRSGEGHRAEHGTLSMALRYAEANIAVVPMHGTESGRCTCGDPACDRPGAHPRAEYGVFEATNDPELVEDLWKECPNAKIGVAFGAETGLIGLAIDRATGCSQLRELSRRNGKLPRTVRIQYLHREVRLLRHDGEGGKVSKGQIADGLQILGDYDFIVAPSSLQPTVGETARFVPDRGLGQVKIARAPQWLIDIGAKRSSALAVPPAPRPVMTPSVLLVATSEIKPEKVSWIWPGMIASGRVTGLVGYPGVGKSQVSIDVAATISTGRPWPRGAANGKAGTVIILSAEDDAADTLVPRLMAAGANRAAVHRVKSVKDNGVERAFSLAADLERLEREYDLSQVRLLIVDPISAYLVANNGGVNRNRGADVRGLLDRLTAFAGRHDLGVLGISHLNKASGTRAITRVMITMKILIDKILQNHIDEVYSHPRPRRNCNKLDRQSVLAEILENLEAAGDVMRYLDAKGRIAWKATPQLCRYLADLQADAEADAEDEAM
jgi:hypothetical protein